MLNKTYKTIKSFIKCRSGNIAIISGILMLPLMLSAGAALDYSRYSNAQSSAQNAVDSAVLASVREIIDTNNFSDARRVANSFFDANFSAISSLNNVNRDLDIKRDPIDGSISVTFTLTGEQPTTLMRLANLQHLDVNASANATIKLPRLEISLVVDISQSMRQNNRLNQMKLAAENFVNTINPEIGQGGHRVISLIPFANNVNLGSSFTNFLGDGIPNYPNSDFVGCYEPDGDNLLRTDNINPVLTDGDPRTGMLSFTNRLQKRFNYPFCPPNTSRALMFSDDGNELISRIRNLDFGFGTGTDVAISWGWKALSPRWRGLLPGSSNFPRAFDDKNQKFIILLTDGAIIRRNWVVNGGGVGKVLADYNDEASDNFEETCNNLKAQGEIRVFTIGYDTARLGVDLRDSLRNCASNPGDFFEASVDQINKVFSQIASEITNPLLTN